MYVTLHGLVCRYDMNDYIGGSSGVKTVLAFIVY